MFIVIYIFISLIHLSFSHARRCAVHMDRARARELLCSVSSYPRLDTYTRPVPELLDADLATEDPLVLAGQEVHHSHHWLAARAVLGGPPRWQPDDLRRQGR